MRKQRCAIEFCALVDTLLFWACQWSCLFDWSLVQRKIHCPHMWKWSFHVQSIHHALKLIPWSPSCPIPDVGGGTSILEPELTRIAIYQVSAPRQFHGVQTSEAFWHRHPLWLQLEQRHLKNPPVRCPIHAALPLPLAFVLCSMQQQVRSFQNNPLLLPTCCLAHRTWL